MANISGVFPTRDYDFYNTSSAHKATCNCRICSRIDDNLKKQDKKLWSKRQAEWFTERHNAIETGGKK